MARFAAPSALPSAAVRNFLLLVEADGGWVFESDDRLTAWADEVNEAERLGFFRSDGGYSVGYCLTLKGQRFLRGFKATSPATLMVLNSSGPSYPPAPGLALARDANPEG